MKDVKVTCKQIDNKQEVSPAYLSLFKEALEDYWFYKAMRGKKNVSSR